MKNIFSISFILSVWFSNASNAQIFAERAINEGAYHKIFIIDKNPEKNVIIDSVEIAVLYSEISFFWSEKRQILYVAYSTIGTNPKTHFQGKSYFIDQYVFDENKKIVRCSQHFIEEENYKDLFRKGLILNITEKGIQLSFSQGKIALMVFSFDELNLNILLKDLSRIAKL